MHHHHIPYSPPRLTVPQWIECQGIADELFEISDLMAGCSVTGSLVLRSIAIRLAGLIDELSARQQGGAV